MNSTKIYSSSLARPRINFARLKRPSPLPVRPLPVDYFRPPRGQKEVYLPNFVLTFLHTPTKPANQASFLVPLWFSKLDLKDYLYNAYRVQTIRIRSYVIQSRVEQDNPQAVIRRPRRWFRPQSQKKMTVELVTTPGVQGQGPFVWPEEPSDYSPWAKEEVDKETERSERENDRMRAGRQAWPRDLKEMRDKARKMMEAAGREFVD